MKQQENCQLKNSPRTEELSSALYLEHSTILLLAIESGSGASQRIPQTMLH
jgi:hypothetical protein